MELTSEQQWMLGVTALILVGFGILVIPAVWSIFQAGSPAEYVKVRAKILEVELKMKEKHDN